MVYMCTLVKGVYANQSIVLYCIVLYCIVLYCIVLYCRIDAGW